MPVIPAGARVPELSLARFHGERFTRADLEGRLSVLVFYRTPSRRSARTSSSVYHEVLDDFTELGATLYGVSCDSVWAQEAFREKLGLTIEQLSDFEPKGAACRAFGVLHPAGFPQRALVIVDPDLTVRWSYEAPSPGDLPGANLIFDALASPAPTG